jgi:hypothetical protein
MLKANHLNKKYKKLLINLSDPLVMPTREGRAKH